MLKTRSIILFLLFGIFTARFGYSQYFQGSFSLGTNDTVVFKIKPIGSDITTRIAYMEFAFRYETAQSAGLSVSSPVSNTAIFGTALNVVSYPPNYTNAGKTYLKFVHNTGVLNSFTFVAGTEYEVFKVKLSLAPTQAMNIEMSSDFTAENYLFAIINAADQLYNAGSNNQLYGTGFYVSGTGHFLPLLGIVAPSAPLVSSPLSYCQHANATPLTANGTSLLWYTSATGGTGTSSAPTPSTQNIGSTDFYVTQTINGIESPRSLLSVIVNPAPQAPIVNNSTYCQGNNSTPLTATGDSLRWYTSAAGGTGNSVAPVPSTSIVGTQQYFVSQTVGGCESPRSAINVIVQATPVAPTATSAVAYCLNATATSLTATGTSLLWYNTASGGTGNTSSPVPSTATTGISHYYVSQTAGTCESPRTDILVTVNAIPAAPSVTSPMSYCLNSTSTSLTATGSNLLWYNQTTGGTGTATAPIPSTNSTGSTNYYVSQSQNNCESPRSLITVNVTDRVTPTFNIVSQVCNGGDIPVLPATASNGIVGAWTPSVISNVNSGSYTFVPNASQCASNLTLSITVNPNPYPNTRYPDVTAYAGTNTTLHATSYTGANYLWTPANGLNNSSIQNPVFNYNQQMAYLIHITSAEGCKITDTLQVNIMNALQPDILVAQGFTPNGDGKNDLLIPNLKGIKKLLYFKVFDRWGQLVFQTGSEARGWDGYYKGSRQPSDTYLWIAEGIDNNDNSIKRNGSFVLIR